MDSIFNELRRQMRDQLDRARREELDPSEVRLNFIWNNPDEMMRFREELDELKAVSAARTARRRQARRRGRASTIFAGEDDDVPSVRAVLLGQ